MADPQKELITYRRADGEPIGDYAWVTDTEFFDNPYENFGQTEVIKEVWVLRHSETLMLGPEPEPEEDDG